MIAQIVFMSTLKFTYTAAFFASIDRVISQERLSRYLAATKGDIGTALELYEHNIAISEALFGFLHGLEVAVRNSVHYTLRRDLGTPTWYDGGVALPWSTTGEALSLTAVMADMVKEAKAKLQPTALPGKVIAELTFGFWSNILTKRFHSTLWLPSLHRAFPHATAPRSIIHLPGAPGPDFRTWDTTNSNVPGRGWQVAPYPAIETWVSNEIGLLRWGAHKCEGPRLSIWGLRQLGIHWNGRRLRN
jgi:hypothetical protein